MTDTSSEQLSYYIDEITKSYDQLRDFETKKCTKEELESIVRHIRDVVGNFPSILTTMFKENPATLPFLKDFVSLFKPPFLPTLNMQLMVSASASNIDEKWIKTQLAMTLGYLNGDGYIDGLKAIRGWLK